MAAKKAPTKKDSSSKSSAQSEKRHIVKAHVKIPELAKAGASMEFELYAEGKKLGTIVIGQGSFSWYGKKRTNRGKLDWTKFADFMDTHFYGE